jgi:hypothetical protein
VISETVRQACRQAASRQLSLIAGHPVRSHDRASDFPRDFAGKTLVKTANVEVTAGLNRGRTKQARTGDCKAAAPHKKIVNIRKSIWGQFRNVSRQSRSQPVRSFLLDRAKEQKTICSRGSRNRFQLGRKGKYFSEQPFHLFRYLSEWAFRYNSREPSVYRKLSPGRRSQQIMSAVLNIHAPSVEVTVGAIPDGKIIDFLTGVPVLDTPEEYVRQNIEKALVRQYRYDPTNCLPEFPIKVGSSRKRVDIVAFESADVVKNQENAHLLVETKRAGTNPAAKKEGVDQLKSYLATCLNAKYGLWTNGEDRIVFAKRHQNKSIEFEQIVDIPIFGQSEAEAQRPKRKDLMPATADNLLFAFKRCHNYVAGTEGMHKPDAFWELLKLIFCKIEDERSGVLQFYVTPVELSSGFTAAAAKTRVQKILEERVVEKYPTIFVGADRELNLKPNVVAYVVSQLQRYPTPRFAAICRRHWPCSFNSRIRSRSTPLFGRPSFLPFALAFRIPAVTRSRIKSRSSCATADTIVKSACPNALEVSMFS